MTKTFSTAILCGLLLVVAASVRAQEPAARQQQLEQMKQRLQLTPEQVEQVRPILQDEFQKLRALREQSGGGSRRDRMHMGRAARGIRKEADEKLKKILSKKQMEELKKIREERKQQFRERSAGK